MHGHTRWVSRERPDFARGAPERCWIDGDLIRLSQFPVGGIRPGACGKPVPWLMDLGVLEEAMQDVYGSGFRLGNRAPLLQLAADALAEGDRSRAAEIADAVAFPAPEFKSRLPTATTRKAIMSTARTIWFAFRSSFIGSSAITILESPVFQD